MIPVGLYLPKMWAVSHDKQTKSGDIKHESTSNPSLRTTSIPLGPSLWCGSAYCTCLSSTYTALNMGRLSFYRSPSSKLRSQRRLSNFLRTKLSNLSSLPPTRGALGFSNSSLEIPPHTPHLVKTNTEFTNYPQPCKTCFLPQCHFDMKHKWDFAVSNPMFELMAKYCDPPDKWWMSCLLS